MGLEPTTFGMLTTQPSEPSHTGQPDSAGRCSAQPYQPEGRRHDPGPAGTLRVVDVRGDDRSLGLPREVM
jgi:hypothetical protein